MMKTLRETNVGKAVIRLLQTATGYTGILVSDGKRIAEIRSNDPDELWQELNKEVGKLNPQYFGYDGAKLRFCRFFPGGFSGGDYTSRERSYKLAAKKRLDSIASPEAAATSAGLGEPILRVFQQTNMLSPFEKTRLREVLLGRDGDAFIHGAARFSLGEIQDGLQAMAKALKIYEAAKWTVVTYLPFLWRPERHMFLKPEVTKDYAVRVGHDFAHHYAPQLTAPVYQRLLHMAEETRRVTADLKPADNIDIQSFIWVVGAYTEADAIA